RPRPSRRRSARRACGRSEAACSRCGARRPRIARPSADPREKTVTKSSVHDGLRRRGAMGDREARTQDARVCGHTGAAEDAASRRPAWPGGTSVIVNRVLRGANYTLPVSEIVDVEAPLEWDTPLFRQALGQFEQALPHAAVSTAVAERLRYPERSLMVSIPVRLDSGAYRVFAGYRVQHSTVLGPTKGGIRYDSEVSLGECAALAMWMTWKCALLQLPYGGAKGGVRCNARELSQVELQRITRRFTIELIDVIGPQEDIPAPDMAT